MKRVELRRATLQDEGNQLVAFPGNDWRKNNCSSSTIVFMPFMSAEFFPLSFLPLKHFPEASARIQLLQLLALNIIISGYFTLGLKIKSMIFFYYQGTFPAREHVFRAQAFPHLNDNAAAT